METNITALDLLNKIIKEGYAPNEEETKMLITTNRDIIEFVEHWDEGNEEPQSPYKYINKLNKMARENKVYEHVNIAKLSKLLKKIHGRRYGFDPCILDRNEQGAFVTLSSIYVDKYIPIEQSLSGYLNAFLDKIFEYNSVIKHLNTTNDN